MRNQGGKCSQKPPVTSKKKRKPTQRSPTTNRENESRAGKKVDGDKKGGASLRAGGNPIRDCHEKGKRTHRQGSTAEQPHRRDLIGTRGKFKTLSTG